MYVVCIIVNQEHDMMEAFRWREVCGQVNAYELPGCCWHVEGVQFVTWFCVIGHKLTW